MKVFKKLIYVFMLVLVFSCQEEIDQETNTNQNTPPSTTLKEKSANNLKKIILNTDSSIKYPVRLLNFFTDSEKTTSNSFLNDEDFLSHLNNLDNSNVVTVIVYPITFIKKDQTKVVLNNNEDLEQEVGTDVDLKNEDYLTAEMLNKINLLKDTNTTFSYPLEFKIRVKIPWSNSVILSKTINNQQELTELLIKKGDTDHRSFAIMYPVTVYKNLQEKIVLKNNEDLLALKIDTDKTPKNVSKKLITLLNTSINSGTIKSLDLNIGYTNANNKAHKFVRFDVNLQQYKEILNGEYTDFNISYPFYINDIKINNDTELDTYLYSVLSL